MNRRRCPTIALVLLLAAAVTGPAVAAGDDPILARAFEVHYRSLADAADLVGELLSDDGSLTLKPRLNTLIVEDRDSVLIRVAALLESYDLPPRTVEVTLSLFLGRRDGDPGSRPAQGRGQFSQEVRGVIETLGDFTKWTSYEPLGSRSVTMVEGDPVVADISSDYRVAFRVESVHEAQGVIKFERVSLQRVLTTGDGRERLEDLYTAGMVVKVETLTLVVAASSPESNRALFLALQAKPR